MRTWVLLSASALALVATSCAQTEPQVLTEGPRSATATELTSASATSEREAQPGRFIARCSTEADGGTPGMTFFTDGTQNVTDHCLSRYYVGVQPAPGALYVADEDAGTYAPTRPTGGETTSNQWTPAQPRTDTGPATDRLPGIDGSDPDRDEAGEDDSADTETTTGTPTTSPEATSPDSPTPTTGQPTTTPGQTGPTTPGQPGQTTPGDVDPTTPGDSGPGGAGSSEPAPTTVPTSPGNPGTAETAPQPVLPPPFGWPGSGGLPGSASSRGLPVLPWPTPFPPNGASG